MIHVLVILTRAMRVVQAGPTPATTAKDLLAAALATASPAHRALASATHTMTGFLADLSTAVFTGRRYSEVNSGARMNAAARTQLDEATLYVAEA